MVDAFALNASAALAIATLGFSIMLALVSVVSYSRLRKAKLLVAGGAFLVLAAKGALETWRAIGAHEADVAGNALDFAVLAFLYASVALR
ncbi:MAG: hypothetical protein ACYDCK_14405 [Thermoplasmatota archaeon]